MNLIVFLKDKNSGFLGGSHEHMGCELELGFVLWFGCNRSEYLKQNIITGTSSHYEQSWGVRHVNMNKVCCHFHCRLN